MNRAALCLYILCMAVNASGGFKVKLVKPKKPEEFQVHTTKGGVTYAADLLLKGKNQKRFFYEELTPSNIIALRLAVFNNGAEDLILPLESLQLFAADGTELLPIAPESVTQAVLRGLVVMSEAEQKNPPVIVSPNIRSGDPRLDPTDPRYDPRYDPRRPGYDPTDPRVIGDPGGTGPYTRPGVDVVLSPGGGSVGDLTQYERALVEKDFRDKVHSKDPVVRTSTRDKFIYFSMPNPSSDPEGFLLRLPPSQGMPEEIVFKF